MFTALLKFKYLATRIILISAAIELLLFFSLKNIWATTVLIYGWYLLKKNILTNRVLYNFPVSFLMLFGLSIIHFILPLPLTLLELKPITYNLRAPFLTFTHLSLFVTVIVLAHIVYRKIAKNENIFRRILRTTDFYKNTTDRQVWIISILSLFASFYIYFIYGKWQSSMSDRNLYFYIANYFTPYLWMPVLLPFVTIRYNHFKLAAKNANWSIKNVLVFSSLVITIGIASNIRTLIFSGILLVASIYIVGLILGLYQIERLFTIKKLVIGLVLFLLVTGPLMDLTYAMLYVRQSKYELSTLELLKETVKTFNDEEVLDDIKKIDINKTGSDSYILPKWDEKYLNNKVLNRFCNFKIADNCLFYASELGYSNPIIQEDFIWQLKALLPNALLDIFNIDYSKKIATSSYSITDFLYSETIGDPTVKGSFIIGSMPGIGMAIFGYWYLLVVFILFIPLFMMFDSFVNILKGKIVFSFLFFVKLPIIINFFNDRHVFLFETRFIMRTYFEMIITFLVIMSLIRKIDQLLKKDL